MEIPKGFSIVNSLPLTDEQVAEYSSIKEIWESAADALEELVHRKKEMEAIYKGMVFKAYYDRGLEHKRGATLLFDPERKAIIEVVDDEDLK